MDYRKELDHVLNPAVRNVLDVLGARHTFEVIALFMYCVGHFRKEGDKKSVHVFSDEVSGRAEAQTYSFTGACSTNPSPKPCYTGQSPTPSN